MYEFGGKEQVIDGTKKIITISGDTIDEVESFKNLRFCFQKSEKFEEV